MSERAWAEEVAERIGSSHATLPIAPEPESLATKVVAAYGDLHGDVSAVPTLALSAEIRRHVTVALSGDGGDELLGGYTRYKVALEAHRRYRNLPGAVTLATKVLMSAVPTWVRGNVRLGRLSSELSQSYLAEHRAYATRRWPSIVKPGAIFGDPLEAAMARHSSRRPLLQMMACDIECYLPEDNCTKVDRASMAVGLEVRSPFMDHRLFELVMRARPEWLVDDLGTKRPLRRLFAHLLPSAVFSRQKMGFAPPFATWLRKIPSDHILEQINSSGLREALVWKEVERQVRYYELGVHGFVGRIWSLLVAAEWWRRWNPRLSA
jgi:asparagine synthase (glutamine-hydrolysing)